MPPTCPPCKVSLEAGFLCQVPGCVLGLRVPGEGRALAECVVADPCGGSPARVEMPVVCAHRGGEGDAGSD